MHRAFHAMQASLTAPDGQPTNAVFGFFSMLSKTLGLLNPDVLVVAFDEGKPTARIEALAQYKIKRKPTDPDLKLQFPMVKELLAAMRVPVACVPDVEGDDILGTLSLQGEQLGMCVYLATSDRDAYQLITQRTSVISQGRGTEGPRIITPADVVKRYAIVPEQIIDFLGLKGDSGDNIPGVPGVGEKTAAKFLKEYGSLDGVLEAAEQGKIKGKVGQSIADNREAAEISRCVATIVRDIPLDIDLGTLHFGDYGARDIAQAFMRYELRSPLGWMLKFGKQSHDDAVIIRQASGDSSDSSAELDADDEGEADEQLLEESPYKGIVISSSGDTLFDNEQILVVASSRIASSASVASDDSDSGEEASDDVQVVQDTSVAPALAELLQSDEQFAATDIKALFSEVSPPDNTIAPALDSRKLDIKNYFDLRIAAYLLASHKTDFSLKVIVLEYLGLDIDDLPPKYSIQSSASGDSSKDRAAEEARLIARLAALLEARLKEDDSLDLYRKVELPLIAVLARMERAGITVDRTRLDELAAYGRDRVDALRSEIFELAGSDDFNPDSPKQIAEILFDRLNLPVIRKTQKGRSTDAKVLAELAHHHPIAAKIVEYREFAKLQNTYLDAFPRLIAPDGRIHTSYNQAVAATGRLSSSNPNLQNIPVRTELGRRIREAFVPCEGWKLVSVDYSQIELRVLAQLSDDPGLIEAFNSGEDFHAETAARIFDLPLDQATNIDPGLRSKAKAVNFGIIYGQGPHGLSQALEVPYGEAKAVIDRYYATFPRVKDYLAETVAFAHEHGYVTTYFGRKRHIPELKSSSRALRAFGERTAMNHPMQGTAADLIKLAMIGVDKRLREEDMQARMLLQVHDELVFEAPPEECVQLSTLVTEVMTSVAPDFKVPLEVNTATGDTWATVK